MIYDRELVAIVHYKNEGIYTSLFQDEGKFQKVALEFLSMLPETKVIRMNAAQRGGISDLLVCYKGQFVALELKDDIGKASPQQIKFIEEIEDAGGVAAVCRTLKDIVNTLHKSIK